MPSLIVVGKTRTQHFDLDDAVTVIGRDGGVNLELSDFKVSRRHALLVRSVEGFFVKDLGSRNGLSINQIQLPKRQQTRLKNGDVLSIGQTTLIFKDLAPGEEEEEEEQDPTRSVDVVDPKPAALEAEELEPEAPEPEAIDPEEIDPEDPEELEDEELEDDEPPPPPTPRPQPPRRTAPKSPPRAAKPARGPLAGRAGKKGPAGKKAIPRALAPNDPSSGRIAKALGAPPAEVLLVQALERSDRERSFYRNLTLFLVCLLVGVMAWLLATALRGEPDPEAAAVEVQGAAPTAPTTDRERVETPRPDLDPEVFATTVHPVLASRCASCHSYVERGGDLVLANSNDALTVEANMHAVLAFVNAANPERSPLLLAPLPKDEGGLPHAGGDVLTLSDGDWLTLRDWVSTPLTVAVSPAPVESPNPAGDAPPVARIATVGPVKVGDEVTLNGSGSADPEGSELFFRWSLEVKPEGSEAVLSGGDLPQVKFVPDRAGRYEVMLLVHDGTESHSARQTVRAALPASDPARLTALQDAAKALLGRSLPQDQAQAMAKQDQAQLVAAFLKEERIYQVWWEEELNHLGLTEGFAPRGEPWSSMPARLESKRFSVTDVLYALAVGSAWNSKHSGKEAYADAILSKILGLDPAQATEARTAARRLYDGYPAEFLGQRGEVQADLVRIALEDDRARAHLLGRSYQVVTGKPIDEPTLRAAIRELQSDPHAFFRLRAEWACQDL